MLLISSYKFLRTFFIIAAFHLGQEEANIEEALHSAAFARESYLINVQLYRFIFQQHSVNLWRDIFLTSNDKGAQNQRKNYEIKPSLPFIFSAPYFFALDVGFVLWA